MWNIQVQRILLVIIFLNLQYISYKLLMHEPKVSKNEPKQNNLTEVTSTTSDRLDLIYNGEFDENVERRFKIRQKRMEIYCNLHKKEKNLQYGITRRLIIDKIHNVTWCPIYKAGSTEWMKIFAIVGGELNAAAKLPNPKIEISKLAKKAFPYLGYRKALKMINDSLTFLIVRHPFERLLSAYRDKLEDKTKIFYHKTFGKYIAKWYRLTENPDPVPTFEEFLRFIVVEKNFDDHWRPYRLECAPCFVNYDYILKMETIDDDQRYLKKILFGSEDRLGKMDNFHNAHPTAGAVERSVKQKYYSKISARLLRSVYEIFEADFYMFGYSPDEYFLMTES